MSDWLDHIEATWPPAARRRLGNWVLRDGQGGGSRVSSARWLGDAPPLGEEVAEAIAAMEETGGPVIFQVPREERGLDAALAQAGLVVRDPTLIMEGEAAEIASFAPRDPTGAVPTGAPLAIMRGLWAEGGVGPERLAVMARVAGESTCLLSRHRDKPAAVAFVARHEDIAMLHALHVVPSARRQGVARQMLGQAAVWALEVGATRIGLATTGENLPAQGVFSGAGMGVVGHYHYRARQEKDR